MDELKLRYFKSVMRHLSFTKAAEDMHVVQATISKQIAALEEELGVKLFYRSHNSVSLTPAGERLAADADGYINQYRAINASVRKLMLGLELKLKIGVGLFEFGVMEDLLRAFVQRNDNVEVNCMNYSYSRLVSHLRSGTVDVGIGTELCAHPLKRLESCVLQEDTWEVAAHVDSAFWTMSDEQQSALQDQIVITTFNNEFEPVRPHCITNRLEYKAFSYSNTFLTLLALLKSDMGIAILPSSLKPDLPAGVRMEAVLDPPLKIKTVAIYQPDSFNEAAHKFMAMCRESSASDCVFGQNP